MLLSFNVINKFIIAFLRRNSKTKKYSLKDILNVEGKLNYKIYRHYYDRGLLNNLTLGFIKDKNLKELLSKNIDLDDLTYLLNIENMDLRNVIMLLNISIKNVILLYKKIAVLDNHYIENFKNIIQKYNDIFSSSINLILSLFFTIFKRRL